MAFWTSGSSKRRAHQAFDCENCIGWIGDRLPFGDLAHQPLTSFSESDHRGRGPAALRIRDNHRVAAFHDGDTAIGSPEVDADYFGHCLPLLSQSRPPQRAGFVFLLAER